MANQGGAHARGAAHNRRRALIIAVAAALIVTVGTVAVVGAGASPEAPNLAGPSDSPQVPTGVSTPPTAARSPAVTATTASARPSPKPTTKAPVAPVSSARKGVCVWTFDGVSAALAASGASWYYTWNTQHQ